MMHVKKLLWPALVAIAWPLLMGCAQLVDLSGPTTDPNGEGRPGSGLPDRKERPPQGGSVPPAPRCATDLSTDAENCGFCEHACGEAECRAGLCTPSVVVQSSDVRLLSAAEDAVFYATEDDVQGCTAAPTATCKSVVDPAIVRGAEHGGSGATQRLTPRALTVFGDRFFVADKTSDMVIGCPKSGCTTASIGVVHDPHADFTGGLFVDALAVIWGDESGIGTAPLPLAGQHIHGDIFSDARARNVTRIEVGIIGGRDQFVYRGSDGVFATSLWRGDTPEQVQQGSVARDFAADAKFIYVAAGAAVMRVDRVTRARSTLAEVPAGQVARIVADDRGVYVTTTGSGSGDGSIFRVGDRGVDRIVASARVSAISLTEKWVYYASDGAVRRVAR